MARCGSPYRTKLRTTGSRSASLSCGGRDSCLSLEAHGGSPAGEWGSAAHWGRGSPWTSSRACLQTQPPWGPATCRHHGHGGPRVVAPSQGGTSPGPGPPAPPHHSRRCRPGPEDPTHSGPLRPPPDGRPDRGGSRVTVKISSLPLSARPRGTTQATRAPWLPLPLSPKRLPSSSSPHGFFLPPPAQAPASARPALLPSHTRSTASTVWWPRSGLRGPRHVCFQLLLRGAF